MRKDPDRIKYGPVHDGINTFIDTDAGGEPYLYATTWLKDGDWLLVVDRAAGTRALFDTRADPGARRDLLAGPEPERVLRSRAASLARSFTTWYRGRLYGAAARPRPGGGRRP